MTFDDDFILIKFEGGPKRFTCNAAGLTWPPPEGLNISGFVYKQTRRSQLTDEQRSGMTHIVRGAEYEATGEFVGGTVKLDA